MRVYFVRKSSILVCLSDLSRKKTSIFKKSEFGCPFVRKRNESEVTHPFETLHCLVFCPWSDDVHVDGKLLSYHVFHLVNWAILATHTFVWVLCKCNSSHSWIRC